MFKVGDKIIINFDKVMEKKDSDRAIECLRLNIGKIFTIKRLPDNKTVELTEEVIPFSNYIHKDFITSVKEQRKEKLNNINKNNVST